MKNTLTLMLALYIALATTYNLFRENEKCTLEHCISGQYYEPLYNDTVYWEASKSHVYVTWNHDSVTTSIDFKTNP